MPLTPHKVARTYTGLGKQTLGGHKQNYVRDKTQEKATVTLEETNPDLPMSVQESPAEVWSVVACCRVGGTKCSCDSKARPFEGDRHYLHYLHHSLASGQIAGREHSPGHQQKIGLKIYCAWSDQSEQDPVSPSVSLPTRKLP